jgi:D-alanine-D-alanine ligase
MKTIGVFFGSRSPEHDISIITAQLIISGLKDLDYKVIPIYLNKSGEWLIGEDLGQLKNFTDGKKEIANNSQYKKYFLDLEKSVGKMVFKKKGFASKEITIDLAFPAFHGAFGEDGTMQGLFEMFNLPYAGCGIAASAIAMDKALTKQIFQAKNLPTTKFTVFEKSNWLKDKNLIINRIKNDLNWPIFIKPVHLGSSIGMAKVKTIEELENKIEVAFYYDDKVLAEEAVDNLMDVTCCVIGNENLTASLLQESVFQTDLFDFEEKYLKKGGSQLGKSQSGVMIPARIEQDLTKEIQKTAKKAYKAIGCSGIARIDFLLNKETKEFFVNEVNPLPGTLYHHLWQKSGLELKELLQKLVVLAEERYKNTKELTRTFDSNVLQNPNSNKV